MSPLPLPVPPWDLAATTASPRLDRSRILAAYGAPVGEAQLRTCERLRRLDLTIWYAVYAERDQRDRRRGLRARPAGRLTIRRGDCAPAGNNVTSSLVARHVIMLGMQL
jgi:hypothetical protein